MEGTCAEAASLFSAAERLCILVRQPAHRIAAILPNRHANKNPFLTARSIWRHDCYGLHYDLPAYALERMEKPFVRIENREA